MLNVATKIEMLCLNHLNHFKLQAILFDNACNFNAYLLNREPREFEFKRVLVDSFHYQNHNSFSSSYDASKYKKYLPQGFYTTGREQINSKLQKLEESFRQMSYKNYFLMHKMFFHIENLRNRGIIE